MKRKRDRLPFEDSSSVQERKFSLTKHPSSLTRSVSPPPILRRKSTHSKSITAQVEAGERDVEDHQAFFSAKLLSATRAQVKGVARLNHRSWIDLYLANHNHPNGHHFVIHQHDHPVAGIHYDLRLQCNETSSVSWAIMYGLPGDPNSRRLNRNATETRVHCLWNHLIETASHQTGTLLIWDTGVYEVLPYRQNNMGRVNSMTTDEENSDVENELGPVNLEWMFYSEQSKLHKSFQNRKIRLRLHGTRLPENYTLSLWLRRENYRSEQPAAPKTRRRKGDPIKSKNRTTKDIYNTDSEREREFQASPDGNSEENLHTMSSPNRRRHVSSLHRHESPPPLPKHKSTLDQNSTPQPPSVTSHTESSNMNQTQAHLSNTHSKTAPAAAATTTTDQNEQIRLTNAYPGASNTINSVHQRKWYLSMDRPNSGFIKSASSSNNNNSGGGGGGGGGGKWIARSSTLTQQHNAGSTTTTIPTAAAAAAAAATHSSGSNARSRSDKEKHNDNDDDNGARSRSRSRQPQGFNPFYVRGRDHERSVVTGRLAADILEDEGVVGYVSRGEWRAVVE